MWLSMTHINAARAEEDKGQFRGWLEVSTHSRPTFPGARSLRLQLKGCWRWFVFSGPRTDLLSVPDARAPSALSFLGSCQALWTETSLTCSPVAALPSPRKGEQLGQGHSPPRRDQEEGPAAVPKPLKNFPGAPVVKNPPCNAGKTGLIPGWETKVPHAVRQLNPRAATTVLN